MVSVTITPIESGKLKVVFSTPEADRIKYEPTIVSSYSEANRQMYFRNRDYIYRHILNFLKQRQYALTVSKFHAQVRATERIITNLHVFSESSYANLCRFIHNNEGAIKELAPGEKSKHFKHYNNIIEPILIFCRPYKMQNNIEKIRQEVVSLSGIV
jgi:hypothetical protein